MVRRVAAGHQQEAIVPDGGVDVVRQRGLIGGETRAGERHPVTGGSPHPPGAEQGAPHLAGAPAAAAEVLDEGIVAPEWLPAGERPKGSDWRPCLPGGAPEEGGKGRPVSVDRGPDQ